MLGAGGSRTRPGARGAAKHGHLVIAHYSFIELEQDSCYCWTVTLTPCKPRLAAPAEGEATATGPRTHTWDGAQRHLLHQQD